MHDIVDIRLTIVIISNYFRFDHCAEESFRKPGESLCSVGSVEGLHSMITDVLSTSVEFLCGDYKADNDKCDSVNDRHQNLKNVTINNPRKNTGPSLHSDNNELPATLRNEKLKH